MDLIPVSDAPDAPDNHKTQTSFKLPVDLSTRLRDAADDRGLGIAKLAEKLIRKGLDELVPADQIPLSKGG